MLYDYIIYDSETESRFAASLDRDEVVKLFFKIPERFKISTPLANYSPDWAVYVETENEKKMHFIIETKGSMDIMDLRDKEKIKICCGKEHFKALDTGIDFELSSADWKGLKNRKL